MSEESSNWFKRHKKLSIISGIILVIFTLIGIGSVNNTPTSNTTSTNTASDSSDDTSAAISTQPSLPPCTSYQTIDSQTWLEVVKDPDSYKGRCYTVYGEVTQFDAATGTSEFRADVGGVRQTPSYGYVSYPTNTYLTGDANTLKPVVEKDLFTANVMVLGSYSYDTQIGGNTTVPQLQVDTITVTGTVGS